MSSSTPFDQPSVAATTASEHGEREKAKPLLSIDELLFDESQSIEDTETGLLAFGAKQLRTACYCRQLRIVKSGAECNDNKLGYVALLMKLKRAYAEMQQLHVEGGPPKAVIGAVPKRKSRHCIPRLLNVISSIWVQIHEEFLSPRPEYAKLGSELVTFSKCDPGKIIHHDAGKLREMWKDVSSRYNTALTNSKQSGTNENDFFSFCSGKIDVLYMHEILRNKQGLLASVTGKLPKRARLNTMRALSSDFDVDESESDASTSRKKQRTGSKIGKSPSKGDIIERVLSSLDKGRSDSDALAADYRLSQLVATYSTLLQLRERMVRAPTGVYTDEEISDVENDISVVRQKKKDLVDKMKNLT
eukprot:jgi/Phyca11/102562/e_gw1.7.470.1